MPNLITLAQGALDIANGLRNAELIRAIVELKNEAAGLLTENQEMKEQIKALKEEKENPLVYNDEDGLFYSADDADNRHPFCPACYESSKKRLHIVKYNGKCPICGTAYRVKDSAESPAILTRHRGKPDWMDGYW
jgi:hypothetical protein